MQKSLHNFAIFTRTRVAQAGQEVEHAIMPFLNGVPSVNGLLMTE